jgi:hypothetical protein
VTEPAVGSSKQNYDWTAGRVRLYSHIEIDGSLFENKPLYLQLATDDSAGGGGVVRR